MRYHLRTLLLITTLAAIVAAGFAYDLFYGILAYLACLTHFMWNFMWTWRTRIVCQQLDLIPPAKADYLLALKVLLSGGAVALAAVIAFCTVCSTAQLPFVELRPDFTTKFKLGLLLSLSLGTLSALAVYWSTWPRNV
jgi:hypothetical protein